MRVRNSLLPYPYTVGRETWETGLPAVRGLYMEDAADEDVYRFDQYYFGPSPVVAPVVSADPRRRSYLPAGRWWTFELNALLPGGMEIVRDVDSKALIAEASPPPQGLCIAPETCTPPGC